MSADAIGLIRMISRQKRCVRQPKKRFATSRLRVRAFQASVRMPLYLLYLLFSFFLVILSLFAVILYLCNN